MTDLVGAASPRDLPASRPGLVGEAPLLVGFFMAALSSRVQVVALAALATRIRVDLGLSHSAIGVLLTIPILCMGVFAPWAGPMSRKVSTKHAVTLSLLGIATFGLIRALFPRIPVLFLTTVGVGVGTGLAGALLPILVKETYSQRPAFGSGVYASGIQFGSAMSAWIAVPVAQMLGGWRGSMVAQSGLVFGICALWVFLSSKRFSTVAAPEAQSISYSQTLLWLVVMFMIQAFVFHGISSWLPEIYVDHGWSQADAGNLLATMNITGLIASFGGSWLMEHMGSRRLYLILSAFVFGAALLGILLLRDLGWVWAITAGMSLGVLFVVVVTLPLDVSRGPHAAGAVAGVMFAVGYLGAATAPFILGFLRDATGSFDASLLALLAMTGALILVSLPLDARSIERGIHVRV